MTGQEPLGINYNTAYTFLCLLCAYLLTSPKSREITKSTRNTKKRTLAIAAAPEAMPPKPNNAAINAITRNTIVQRNIIIKLWLKITGAR